MTLFYFLAKPSGPIVNYVLQHPWLWTVINQIPKTYANASGAAGLRRALGQYSQLRATSVPPNIDADDLMSVAEELRVQKSLEERWQDLLRTVAPEAGDQEAVFQLLKLVIEQAESDAQEITPAPLTGTVLPPRLPPPLPPQFEQSLERIVRWQR